MISSVTASMTSATQARLPESVASEKSLTTKQAFQDFVAGTFYKQMFKAMRSTQGEVQYLNGGQAEQMFRSQLDQHLAESLARDHGEAFAAPLYSNFESYQEARQNSESQLNHLA